MNTHKLNKKGSLGKAFAVALGVMAVAILAPIIYGDNALGNSTAFASAPTWLLPILTLVAGFALVRVMVSKQ